MAEKSLSLKFGAAIYYMVASMVVQFVNKVCRTCNCDASDAVPILKCYWLSWGLPSRHLQHQLCIPFSRVRAPAQS